MKSDPHSDVFTICVGGAAGDGVREAGTNIGRMLSKLGYEVYVSHTYPSLIRGGHNYTRVSFGTERIWTDHDKLDVLIALNAETVKLHRGELSERGVIFADGFDKEDLDVLKEHAVSIPMAAIAKETGAPAIARNSSALGALCYLLDLPLQTMVEVLHEVFKEKSLEFNIELAKKGHHLLEEIQFRHSKTVRPNTQYKRLVEGNVAFGKGLMAAGLDYYLAYPMTPSSTILHFLAREQKGNKHKAIQAENEISVINMALGMAYAGKRVAIGSATGGFALMQEALSFAGIAELPLVIAVSQRQGPATGVPTYSSQSDLRFVTHAGHGEFPRIVVAPGDPEEAFWFGGHAMNLAWHYQMPVIVLLDKIVSEHGMSSLLDVNGIGTDEGRRAYHIGERYKRYQFSPDGISPMAFPGTPGAVVKVTSYEHDEEGITTEEAHLVQAMTDKRFSKLGALIGESRRLGGVRTYGDESSSNVVLCWGSTKGPVLEALKYLDKPVKVVQIAWVEPLDVERTTAELIGRRIINIEANRTAQMAGLIREKTGIHLTEHILRWDSRPFDPIALAGEINRRLA